MKRSSGKLQFRVETVRNLTPQALSRVAGGMSSARQGLCSTDNHVTHCLCPDFTAYDTCSATGV